MMTHHAASFGRGMKRVGVVAAVAGALGAMLVAPPAASAEEPPGGSCWILEDGVDHRKGPGGEYESYGKLRKGQELAGGRNVTNNWIQGDVVNGQPNAWVYLPLCGWPR